MWDAFSSAICFCHSRSPSTGLSSDDTISLGRVSVSPPPAPGCIDTPKYRWILAASHPHSRQAPGGCAFPGRNQCSQCSQYRRISAPRSHTHSLTGLQDLCIPPPGNSPLSGARRNRGAVTQRGRAGPGSPAEKEPVLGCSRSARLT